MEELHAAATRSVTTNYSLEYLLYLPDQFDQSADDPYSLVLFLHGAGERGQDLELVKKQGLQELLQFQATYNFILVAPQCPPNTWWVDQMEVLDQILDDVQQTYPIDLDRIYLTGLSMGGYGSWHYAVRHPQRFAAVAPICGGGTWWHGYPEAVKAIKDVPVWAFHGADDDIVPLSASEVLVDALKEEDGRVRFTIYPGVDHDSWTQTYSDPDLYRWMFSQTRNSAAAARRIKGE